MWPVQVVVDPPFFDDFAGMTVAAEQVLVETLVPQAPVEAFNEAILHGFAGCDVVPLDAAVLLPGEHDICGQFRAVVAATMQG